MKTGKLLVLCILVSTVAAEAVALDERDLYPGHDGWTVKLLCGTLTFEPFTSPDDSYQVGEFTVMGRYVHEFGCPEGGTPVPFAGPFAATAEGNVVLLNPDEKDYDPDWVLPRYGTAFLDTLDDGAMIAEISVEPMPRENPLYAAIVRFRTVNGAQIGGMDAEAHYILKPEPLEMDGIAVEKFVMDWYTSYQLTANSRVRRGPSTGYDYDTLRVVVDGAVEERGSLPGGRLVHPIARTVGQFPVGEWSDHWYLVDLQLRDGEEGPVFGWIYGALIAAIYYE